MTALIHGQNLANKLRVVKDEANRRLLVEIKERYDHWHEENMRLQGCDKKTVERRVALLNEYMNFINEPRFRKEKGNRQGFTAQSQLHSSVLEQFMYYLFKDVPILAKAGLDFGRTKAYTNLYFAPRNLPAFASDPNLIVHVKDQDFAISKALDIGYRYVGTQGEWNAKGPVSVPVVTIECKTYLDKTMYEGSVATAEKIKQGNPYCLFLIATETYEVSREVDPRYSRIDQIYVLRKERRSNPIAADVVWDMLSFVKEHLENEWCNIEEKLKRGKLR